LSRSQQRRPHGRTHWCGDFASGNLFAERDRALEPSACLGATRTSLQVLFNSSARGLVNLVRRKLVSELWARSFATQFAVISQHGDQPFAQLDAGGS
jgi:hypothetical protein